MPKFIECFQHDEFGVPTREWMAARCGRITASRLGDVMAYSTQKGKEGKELKVRADYRSELSAERMTGINARHFVTPEMKWGQEQEDYARSMYEVERGVMVDQIGFAIHPTMDFSGSSPDGLIGSERGVDFKCFTTERHISIYKSKQVPQEIYDQLQWNMVCCELSLWDACFYDPRLVGPYEHLKMFVLPVQYDGKRVLELEAEVRKMDSEINQFMESLK
jgi:hypothetical protein